jgi:hypothetical protein
MIALLSTEGTITVAATWGGAFVVGLLVGALRMRPLIRGGLFAVGPIAAYAAFRIGNPEPGCTYDCPGQAGWALLSVGGNVAWWMGLGIATLFRRWPHSTN